MNVIIQALADAVSQHSDAAEQAERAEAREWLTTPGADLQTVCDHAGVDMPKLIAFAQAHIEAADSGKRILRDSIGKRTTPKKKREPMRYTYDGQSLTAREWAEVTGIPRSRLDRRLSSGWSIGQAIDKQPHPPVKHRRSPGRNPTLYTLNGEAHSLTAWSIRLCIPLDTLRRRLSNGWPVERALTTKRWNRWEQPGDGLKLSDDAQGPAGITRATSDENRESQCQ